MVNGAGSPQGGGLPPAVLAAKTVAIVNDTRDPKVTDGAVAALKSWGQFTVVDDPQVADLTLRFDKTKERSGSNSQTTDPNTNKASYGYSVSVSSQIHMKVYLRDGDAGVYATKTDDSKAKAGMGCVNDFHTAFRAAKSSAP
ncbi:MAG: hypothetical protein ACRYFU_07280 [Janthinobacterium lividum]